MKKALILSFVIGIGIVTAYFFINNQTTQTQIPIPKQVSSIITPSKEQASEIDQEQTENIPFQELTIPYLREQDYTSELSELEEVTNRSTHIGYLTSYQSEGLNINAYLTIPKGEAPDGGFPAVVLVHGYIPPQNYRTLSNYVSFADALAAQGIIVLKIDLRGHGGSEGEASGAYYSSDYIIDTLHAYDALQKLDVVNPDTVGLWGHSMAGNVIVRSWAANPDIPKIIVWAGAVYTYEDFGEYGIDDNSYQPPAADSNRSQKRNELFETHGRFTPDSEFWKLVPAINYLDDLQGEIQIHHPVDDPVVSIEYSRNTEQIFEEAGVPVTLYEYSSGGHNLTGNTFTQAIQRTADFLKQ